jgi:hypothetical protein
MSHSAEMWDGQERRAHERTRFETLVNERLRELRDDVNGHADTLYGNGVPGLKSDVTTMKTKMEFIERLGWIVIAQMISTGALIVMELIKAFPRH